MLNISKQIYVGWDSTSLVHALPEAAMIPLGDSVTEKKKLEKFVVKYPDLAEYDNVPLPGFTLYDVNKRNWGAADSSWLVIDPRGFMVRITQQNMAHILRVSGITEGLIQQRCVWAREDSGTDLSLVPVSSVLYAEAVNNTQMIESCVDMKDVQIGDTVYLQNKTSGTYLGVMSLYGSLSEMNGSVGMKVQGMLRKEVVEITPGRFYYSTDVKILKVTNKTTTPMSREAAVSYVNNVIKTNNNTYFSQYDALGGRYYGARGRVKIVSTHAAPKIKISLEEIDDKEARLLYDKSQSFLDAGNMVIENSRGNKFIIDYPWWGHHTASADEFYVTPIAEITEDRVLFADEIVRSNKTDAGRSMYSLDNFAKFYKIVKSVKNDTYI